MNIISVDNRIINVARVYAIHLGMRCIAFHIDENCYERIDYKTQDEAVIAFSKIRMALEKDSNI